MVTKEIISPAPTLSTSATVTEIVAAAAAVPNPRRTRTLNWPDASDLIGIAGPSKGRAAPPASCTVFPDKTGMDPESIYQIAAREPVVSSLYP